MEDGRIYIITAGWILFDVAICVRTGYMSEPFPAWELCGWLAAGLALAVGAFVAEFSERRAHAKELGEQQAVLVSLRSQLDQQHGALGVISTMSARTLDLVGPRRGAAQLRMFFEPRNPSCVHELPPNHQLGRAGRLWRVGIENTSDVAAEGVCLRVVRAMDGATGLPAALHKMHDTSSPPRTHFTLSPGSTDYWDVLLMPYRYSAEVAEILDLNVDSPTPHIYVCFADPVTPWMPVSTPWTLRFRAEAQNAASPVEAGFHLSFANETLTVGYSDYVAGMVVR
jgi:hypothetical protein